MAYSILVTGINNATGTGTRGLEIPVQHDAKPRHNATGTNVNRNVHMLYYHTILPPSSQTVCRAPKTAHQTTRDLLPG